MAATSARAGDGSTTAACESDDADIAARARTGVVGNVGNARIDDGKATSDDTAADTVSRGALRISGVLAARATGSDSGSNSTAVPVAAAGFGSPSERAAEAVRA